MYTPHMACRQPSYSSIPGNHLESGRRESISFSVRRDASLTSESFLGQHTGVQAAAKVLVIASTAMRTMEKRANMMQEERGLAIEGRTVLFLYGFQAV